MSTRHGGWRIVRSDEIVADPRVLDAAQCGSAVAETLAALSEAEVLRQASRSARKEGAAARATDVVRGATSPEATLRKLVEGEEEEEEEAEEDDHAEGSLVDLRQASKILADEHVAARHPPPPAERPEARPRDRVPPVEQMSEQEQEVARAVDAAVKADIAMAQHQMSGYKVEYPKVEQSLREARAALPPDAPPQLPPPGGWEEVGEAVEAAKEPYFDAVDTLPTLPTDELITSGAPVQDSVTEALGAGAPSEQGAATSASGRHTKSGLAALGEAVVHAAERAAEALRISSEEGTRGTP